jgi:integrase
MARLERRRQLFYAVKDIPNDVQTKLGKKRFLRSTGTSDKDEARHIAAVFEVEWLEQIQAARKGAPDVSRAEDETAARAKRWRERIANAANPKSKRILIDQMKQDASELIDPFDHEEDEEGREAANHFVDMVLGHTGPTNEHLDEFINKRSPHVKPKTADMYRTSLGQFCLRFTHVSDVSSREVRLWVNQLQDQGVADNTINKHLSAARAYWQHLKDVGHAPEGEDPFAEATKNARSSKSRTGKSQPYKPFEPHEVVKLRDLALRKDDIDLANLITLGMWTGCRIGSLCSLRVEDVHSDHFDVNDKTKAGERSVPIHRELKPLLTQLCQSSRDGFVISGLSPNQYGDRSNAIGKRFGRLKTAEGFAGRQWAFHSIRKTVVTQLQRADVPVAVTMSIVGHEDTSLTYGLYSDGPSLKQKQDAIDKLTYPGPE